MTRSLWWFTIAVAGVPLALVSGLAVRRGYTGHLPVLAAATLTTAALYVAFPLGFTPVNHPPAGVGRWEHDHRTLGIAILFVPTLLLLADELFRIQEVKLEAEPDDASLRSLVGAAPRRWLVATGVLLVALVWTAGTNGSGLLLGFGVFFAVAAFFLWRKHRSDMRRVMRDLRPPE